MTRPRPIIKGVPDIKECQFGPVSPLEEREKRDSDNLRRLVTHMRAHYAKMTTIFENCAGEKGSLNPIDAYNKGALTAYQAIVADLDEILQK